MDPNDPGWLLTAADYAICKALSQRLEAGRIDHGRIDDGMPQTRILVCCEFRNRLVGRTLPVTKQYRTVYQPQAARYRRRPAIVSRNQNRSAAIVALAQARNRTLALTRRVSL